jgi:phage shock protein PspC (stress-responsive transcriptional regulator)
MTCTRCGRIIEAESAFCRFCGAPVGAPAPEGSRRLVRRPDEGRLGGVCAGMAEYFGTDVTLVRFVWVILALVPGGIVGGVVAYLALWLIIPAAPGPVPVPPGTRRLVRSTTDRRIAGVCGGLAAYLGVDSTAMRVIWVILAIVPGAVVLGVLAYLVAWLVVPEEPRSVDTAVSVT